MYLRFRIVKPVISGAPGGGTAGRYNRRSLFASMSATRQC